MPLFHVNERKRPMQIIYSYGIRLILMRNFNASKALSNFDLGQGAGAQA